MRSGVAKDGEERSAAGDPARDARFGLAQGGLGGPETEILESGQEEVFSRTEVERGRIEHHAGEADANSPRRDRPKGDV